MSAAGYRRFRLSLSAARRSRFLPTAWRVLGAAIAVVVVEQLSVLLLVAASVAAMAIALSVMSAQASRYVPVASEILRGQRRQRILAFASGLLLVVSHLFLIVRTVGYSLTTAGWTRGELPLLVLVGTALGGGIGLHVFRSGWRAGYAATAAVLLLAAGTTAIVFTARDHDLLAPAELWGRNLVRLTAVFLTAAATQGLARRRRRRLPAGWSANMVQTLAAVAILGLVGRLPGTVFMNAGADAITWVVMVGILAVGLLATLWQARLPVAQDLRWFGSLCRRGQTQSWPMGVALFAALASIPSLALAPIAPWPEWLIVFATWVGAIVLKFISDRTKQTVIRPSPSPALMREDLVRSGV